MTDSQPPTRALCSIVGQRAVINRLRDFAALYTKSGNPPGHILLTGGEGMGKRTLAQAFADELQANLVHTSARELNRAGDLMGVLTNLGQGSVLLIEDVPILPKPVLTPLIQAVRAFAIDVVVDKGIFCRTINVPLKRFTFLGTAGSKAQCPAELVEVFPLNIGLQDYCHEELAEICARVGERKGIAIAPSAALTLARASSGTPRHIEVLVEMLVGLGKAALTEEDLAKVGSVLGLRIASADFRRLDDFENLPGIEFEKLIAALLGHMGFQTEMTEVTGDGGIDIIATLDRPIIGGRYLVQCKRLSTGNLVGASTVRDFYGALTADRSAVKGILVTTSGFTSQAVAFAQKLPIELIDGQGLQELLRAHGMPTLSRAAPPKLFE